MIADPDTGRVRLGWTSGIRVMHGDDYQPVPIQLTLRYFDPSGFEWVIAREAVVISAPYQAHTWFLGNTASLPTGFDGSAIITSTSPRVFGLGTVIDYARPSAVPGQPPADRADVFPLPNAAGASCPTASTLATTRQSTSVWTPVNRCSSSTLQRA